MAALAIITTRDFVLADYERAVALWNEVEGLEVCEGDSREEIGQYLKRNPSLSRVAEANGTMAGVALCGHDGRRGWIYHLAVARERRGRGIAKLLIEECIAGLRTAGIKRAIILVAADNPQGHQFWVRNCWEDIQGAVPMTREI